MGTRAWSWYGGNSASQVVNSLNQSLLRGGNRFDECAEVLELVKDEHHLVNLGDVMGLGMVLIIMGSAGH